MSFIQLRRIKEMDDTPEKAIASYGSFVKFMNDTRKQVKKSGRKGWTPQRIALCRGNQTVGCFHEAIYNKFGREAMYQAVNTHPFD